MKRISAFILSVLYAAYAITSLAGVDCYYGDSAYSIEKAKERVDKDAKKLADVSQLQKIVKHVSTAAKAKSFRSNPVFADAANLNSLYHFFKDDGVVSGLHPHPQHTPIFLRNCVLRI